MCDDVLNYHLIIVNFLESVPVKL